MSHNHTNNETEDNGIKFGLFLNTSYTILEYIFGVFSGSMVLIADATHNLTDTITLALSFFANKLTHRKANNNKTYGYGRFTIFAALLNSVIMLTAAFIIVIEAIKRFGEPHNIAGLTVTIIACIGILVNGSIAVVLSRHKKDLNMKSAFTDMFFDTLSSVGAAIAGLIIWLTKITWIDSAISIVIAIFLTYNTVKIMYEAVHILVEGSPNNVDIDSLKDAIISIPKVLSIDDVHVWTIRSGYNAFSCHITVSNSELKNCQKIIKTVRSELLQNFDIHHVTIEVETKPCDLSCC